MADWSDIEDALCDWVTTATGLAASHVIHADQSEGRPFKEDFITIRLGDIKPVSGTVDEQSQEVVTTDDGDMLELTVQGLREFTVTLQAFESAVTGDRTARSMLANCQTALDLDSVTEAFEDVGISAFDKGTVQNITVLDGAKFEGRAILTIKCYVNDNVSELVSWIETVETTSYIGPPGTIDEIDI